MVEEVTAAGISAHNRARPTPKRPGATRKAKTDRSDARLQRELLRNGEIPESWIPPEAVLEWGRARCFTSRCSISAGCGSGASTPSCSNTAGLPQGQIRADQTRAWLDGDKVQLSPAVRQRIRAGYRMLDATDAELVPLKNQLDGFGGGANRPA